MNVLAVFAHPDDETLACGGTLAKHAANGDGVAILTFTDGIGSRKSGDRIRRRKEFYAASSTLGATRCSNVASYSADEFVDQRLDETPIGVIADIIKSYVETMQISAIYTHWTGDLNADHVRVAEAVLVAARPVAGSRVDRILACEIPESTSQIFGMSFSPNVFVSLAEEHVATKLAALGCYESESREWPHPRSREGVVAWLRSRGATVASPAAEAFVLMREINR